MSELHGGEGTETQPPELEIPDPPDAEAKEAGEPVEPAEDAEAESGLEDPSNGGDAEPDEPGDVENLSGPEKTEQPRDEPEEPIESAAEALDGAEENLPDEPGLTRDSGDEDGAEEAEREENDEAGLAEAVEEPADGDHREPDAPEPDAPGAEAADDDDPAVEDPVEAEPEVAPEPDATLGPPESDGTDDDAVSDSSEDGDTERTTSDETLDPEAVKQRIDELDDRKGGEGHAPGRHLDVTEDQLKDRLGKPILENGSPKLYGPNSQYVGHMKLEQQKDPLTNSTVDGVHGGVHRCGAYATKFENPEDLVTADEYCRKYIEDNGIPPDKVPIEDVLGEDGHERCSGFYLDPSDPGTALKVDFEGGFIKPVYHFQDGAWKLHTMYPNPAYVRHP
ncbi:hypothetical protein [Streptomyces sp. NPDC054975]